jgi:shikimate kinase
MKKLLKQRDPVYAKFADVEVVTGVKPFEDLIKEIESKVQ